MIKNRWNIYQKGYWWYPYNKDPDFRHFGRTDSPGQPKKSLKKYILFSFSFRFLPIEQGWKYFVTCFPKNLSKLKAQQIRVLFQFLKSKIFYRY